MLVELKINNYEDRKKVVLGLINSGYTVRVVEKKDNKWKISGDFYVQILEEPKDNN